MGRQHYGLQAHSIGGSYPFAVVGLGNGHAVLYEVHNLETGEVLHTRGNVAQWYGAQGAIDAASALSQGKRLFTSWRMAQRKPSSGENLQGLVLPPKTPKVQDGLDEHIGLDTGGVPAQFFAEQEREEQRDRRDYGGWRALASQDLFYQPRIDV